MQGWLCWGGWLGGGEKGSADLGVFDGSLDVSVSVSGIGQINGQCVRCLFNACSKVLWDG